MELAPVGRDCVDSLCNMERKEHIPLAPLTTMRVGGSARYFFNVSSVDELREALDFAKAQKLPFFVLGRGSNIIVSDNGFPGVVIKMEIRGIHYEKCGGKIRVIAEAGETWDAFVNKTITRGLYGLENLSFIPGTVGAAPVQNTGAYGVEVKDSVEWVEAINKNTFELKRFSNKECCFSYRDSFFKTQKGKEYIVIRVSFLLRTKGALNTEYQDINKYIYDHDIKDVNLRMIRNIIMEIRMKKIPSMKDIGTAGSFFKNPIVTKKKLHTLLEIYPDIKYFSVDKDRVKIPAAWLLDHVGGWKGFKEGNVGTCPTQPLFIVNYGSGTAQEILAFAKCIVEDIKEKTDIVLELEVQYLE